MSRNARVEQLAHQLLAKKFSLTTAESCTGGGIAKALTEIAGSSAWFGYGFVTYSNQAKHQLLNVSLNTLQQEGAVSSAVVKQMVAGACKQASADIAVAVSGIAGPDGGSPAKPVGSVWLAWGTEKEQHSQLFNFSGNREQIREASIDAALDGLLSWLAALD